MSNEFEVGANGFRRARTRTLIQLGGLFEQAGLLEAVGIIPGSDLQKDPLMTPLSLGLLGALLEIKQLLGTDQVSMGMWKLKAQAFLNNRAAIPALRNVVAEEKIEGNSKAEPL